MAQKLSPEARGCWENGELAAGGDGRSYPCVSVLIMPVVLVVLVVLVVARMLVLVALVGRWMRARALPGRLQRRRRRRRRRRMVALQALPMRAASVRHGLG